MALTTPARLAGRFQNRPLLDMDLEVAGDVGAPIPLMRRRFRIAAEGEERVADLDAVGVDEIEHGRLEHAGDGR